MKRAPLIKTVDNNGPDVGACSAFYGSHWFLFEMAGAVIFVISCRGGKKYAIIISMSLLCVWGMRFAVALLCTLFSGVLAAHKKMNFRNYEKISLMSRTVAPPLFVFAKLLLSLGSVLMFSGLWLK